MKTVYKLYLDGLLKDLVIREITSVEFELGKTYKECFGKDSYKIINIVDSIS